MTGVRSVVSILGLVVTLTGSAFGFPEPGGVGGQEAVRREPSQVSAIPAPGREEMEAAPSLRVGTYDSRFVALAYYRSPFGREVQRTLQSEVSEAREADDQKRLAALEARGRALQNLMHQQVFGNLSIPNVLEHVSDRLPGIAADASVSLLVSKWEVIVSSPDIELVDLTEPMVGLFEIDEETRRMIDEGSKAWDDPVPIEQLLDPEH